MKKIILLAITTFLMVGCNDFGSSAYFVDKKWYEEVNNMCNDYQ